MTTTIAPLAGRPGLDVPDARDRTGLDRVGRDLDQIASGQTADAKTVLLQWAVLRSPFSGR